MYFSDDDVKDFFQKEYPEYYEIYAQMRNGVAIADSFRICYIQHLISKNHNFIGQEKPKIYLKDTKYEFTYQKVNFNTTKPVEYVKLLEKYKQKKYTLYDFL